MFLIRPWLRRFAAVGVMFGAACAPALGRDLRIVLPRRSRLTPVQRLNREGVKALRSRHYSKAESLFYKAYLYDPADPFTLNNLGYLSELRGQLAGADKFYKLAAEQSCDANIAMSSRKDLQGKPMLDAVTNLKDRTMRVNRANIEAIELLGQKHPFEALGVLKQILPADPRNPFTLNNLGVAEEATGNFPQALRYYEEAAATGSREPMVIALNRAWRGKPVSVAAGESARLLRRRMKHTDMRMERAQMLALYGVSQANQNNWDAANRDFLEAYRLDPSSAFSLNNRAYVAARAGDLEAAQYYYSEASRAGDAGSRVGLATVPSAQGQILGAVAAGSTRQEGAALNAYSRSRRGQPGPVKLIPRTGNSGGSSNTHP